MSSDLTEADVQALLHEHGADSSRFPWRIEPQGGQVPDPGLAFLMPVQLPDGNYLGFWFSFGKPDADEQQNWKPRWRKAEGPCTIQELQQIGKGQP